MFEPKADDLVVYLYNEAHEKLYVCGNRNKTYADLNPRHAKAFTHDDAVRLLAKHGRVNGGGFELYPHAYADYIVANDVPADRV